MTSQAIRDPPEDPSRDRIVRGARDRLAGATLTYSIGYAANSLPVPGGTGVLDVGLLGAVSLSGLSPEHAHPTSIRSSDPAPEETRHARTHIDASDVR